MHSQIEIGLELVELVDKGELALAVEFHEAVNEC
jgi:hypothetical protein